MFNGAKWGLAFVKFFPQVHFEYRGPWINDLGDFGSSFSFTFVLFMVLEGDTL